MTGYILTAVLALSLGFTCGHRTARVRHIPVGATREQDNAAFRAHERARWDDLVAQLDTPADLDDRKDDAA
ncbi:hypothetical protein [Streptomyces sp. NPDC127072]|uniref:hypothetical protein n=1 Tax=Streptomyces sp. NPDC127072 TaxID=3347129 RepID=UPI00364F0C3A